MRSLICSIVALVSVEASAGEAELRCERHAEARAIVQAVAAPAEGAEPADLPGELDGALARWLGELPPG
jgi:hypothetical protein